MRNANLGIAGWLLLALGLGFLANGLVMLFDSVDWFGLIATDTGALNVHFVRDVGAAYAASGVALVWGALRPSARGPLTAVATVFLGIHALGHVYETSVGELPPDSWWSDLPGVHLPALVLVVLSFLFLRNPRPEAT